MKKVIIISMIVISVFLIVFLFDNIYVKYERNHFFCERIDYGMPYAEVIKILESKGAEVEFLWEDDEYTGFQVIFQNESMKHIYGEHGLEFIFKEERLYERVMIANEDLLISYNLCGSYPRY